MKYIRKTNIKFLLNFVDNGKILQLPTSNVRWLKLMAGSQRLSKERCWGKKEEMT